MYSRKVGVALLTAGMALGCTNVAMLELPKTKEDQVGADEWYIKSPRLKCIFSITVP